MTVIYLLTDVAKKKRKEKKKKYILKKFQKFPKKHV